MPDNDTGEATTTTGEATASTTTTDDKDWKAEYERLKTESRKWEDRAKANSNAVKELEKFKAAQMTEQEKAVAEAEQRGKAAAQTATAGRLARAEFKAAAAGRVDKDTLDGFLEYADLSKFVDDDGEPDTKAIEAVVKKLAGPQRAPDFDGGARTSASKTTDMNQLVRQKAGLA